MRCARCATIWPRPRLSDETLLSFVMEETRAFFDQTASAEDAARAVAARATAYLNE